MEQFSCKTQILSGPGAISALKDLGIKRLFLVSDPFFSKNGTAQKLVTLSGAEKAEIFDRVIPDPTVELAAEGTARVRQFQPDTLVALGGGSAIDCAKAMVRFSGLSLQFVAIPTTSGSGSEVTDFSVLTHEGVKYPLVDRQMLPHTAILDGELLTQLPKSLVADGGFDALSHAAEAFVATGGTMMTDALASSAFRTVLQLLPDSFAGQIQVRQQLHMASCMAGMAFTGAGLGLCHAMAHSLGGLFHIPHGRLGAILLPAVMKVNSRGVADKYARLARQAGMAAASDTLALRGLINGIVHLRQQLQMPSTLARAGVDPRQVRSLAGRIVEDSLADPCCKTNPVAVTEKMVREVLDEVTGRD